MKIILSLFFVSLRHLYPEQFPAVLHPALSFLFLACFRNLASKSTVGLRF
jgi:hypothetical protein